MATSIMTDPIASIRDDFPILHQNLNGRPIVYLDNAASAQHPLSVINAISNYYTHHHANVHRGTHALSERATDMYEAARRMVADFIAAAEPAEVVFTKGTTEGINLVASGLAQNYLAKGDVILLTEMEHHANIVPWQLACERSGAVIKVVPVLDNGALDLEAFTALINTGVVKVFACTHVSNTLGTVNPVQHLTQVAKKHGALVLIDAAQSVPHIDIDVNEIGADFLVFSSHKMLGPTGIGVLYGKRAVMEGMPPYQGGGEMIDKVTFEHSTWNDLPYKFEAGTPNIAGAIGLDASIKYLMQLGMKNIATREQDLLEYATKGLRQIPNLRIIGEAPHKTSLVSFLVEGCHPYDMGSILNELGIMVRTGHHCNQPLMDRLGITGTVRASFMFYNTEEEIDRLIAGVKQAVKMLT